jgi:hypothetical protein
VEKKTVRIARIQISPGALWLKRVSLGPRVKETQKRARAKKAKVDKRLPL